MYRTSVAVYTQDDRNEKEFMLQNVSYKNAKIHAKHQHQQQQQQFCACIFVRGFSTDKRSKLKRLFVCVLLFSFYV